MEEVKTRAYEIGYLLRNEEAKQALLRHLEHARARIIYEGEPKSIKLSYPIERLPAAYFGYVHFELDPNALAALKNALKLDSEIVRSLIVTPPFLRERNVPPSPPTERRAPVAPEARDEAVSNDLLEEKLEEILNK